MYTDFNENNIYYDIFGEGKNYILLLHGWGCSGEIFDPVVNLLLLILMDMEEAQNHRKHSM